MISHGSQRVSAEMPYEDRSHQLGEGLCISAEMPVETHPSRSVYGSRHDCAVMPMEDRSHQLGKGHKSVSEVPSCAHPPRLVYGSQSHGTAMSHLVRSHQLGEGQTMHAEMPMPNCPSRLVLRRPKIRHKSVTPTPPPPVRGGTPVDRSNARRGPSSPPVYGSLCYHAAMPIYDRSHLFTRGQTKFAEMPFIERLATKEIQYGYKI